MGNTVGLVVTAGVLERDGAWLLCQRPSGKRLAGKWEFPGGKIESGESPEEALARELYEELGIRARVGRVLDAIRSSDAEADALLLFYACRSEDAPVAREHGDMRFVRPEEAAEMDLAPMDARFLSRLRPEAVRAAFADLDARGDG